MTIVHESIDSRHLAGNLLGDPSRRDLFVYLPPQYERSNRRYPVAYLLHWFGTTAAEVVLPTKEDQKWRPPLEDVLDPVFSRMGSAGVIVVIPDGWTSYGCSQWVDSPVNGHFESYVLSDVVSFVDGRFRTLAAGESRAIFGFSSGGFGAWHLASRHPETFGVVAILSGDSYFDLTHKPMVYEYLNRIWPEAPSGPIEGDEASAMVYALAACYSPNVHHPPFYLDLPVDAHTGELVEEIWRRWLTYDMVLNCRERVENLRMLRGILLDSGRNDEYSLQWGHRLLSQRLRELGIGHDVVEHEGTHGSRSMERHQLALRWLSSKLISQS